MRNIVQIYFVLGVIYISKSLFSMYDEVYLMVTIQYAEFQPGGFI
jgi:hypothetical protein